LRLLAQALVAALGQFIDSEPMGLTATLVVEVAAMESSM
jgi:hypothetical protein